MLSTWIINGKKKVITHFKECPVSVMVVEAEFQLTFKASWVSASEKDGKSIGLCSTPSAQTEETWPHSLTSYG